MRINGVEFKVRQSDFAHAFADSESILGSGDAAKLVFIDQCGVDNVTEDVFRILTSAPACDFLFFMSSSFLYRFRDHPAIKQKIERPDDYYHIHRQVLEYYREMLPHGKDFYLSPFSIKKGANIYGLIFGSAHPLGMDKFLQVAWKQDANNGEANFDISRENIGPGELTLFAPNKIIAFEAELEDLLRSGSIKNEADVIRLCFNHGVTRQRSAPILAKLKKEKVISLNFRVPDINRLKSPKSICLL